MKITLNIFNFFIKLFIMIIVGHCIYKFFTIQEGYLNLNLLKMEKKYIKKKFKRVNRFVNRKLENLINRLPNRLQKKAEKIKRKYI
tara:strand:- start:720 stop:977 length:258 start_codon:yes stop_codon:yes gene_type:complete